MMFYIPNSITSLILYIGLCKCSNCNMKDPKHAGGSLSMRRRCFFLGGGGGLRNGRGSTCQPLNLVAVVRKRQALLYSGMSIIPMILSSNQAAANFEVI